MKDIVKKIVFSIAFCCCFSVVNAQITIDNTTYSTTQLVDGVLVPSGSGTVISNVVFRGVYNNSGRYQVGYFSTATTTLAQMGFTNGVVLTSGNTSNIPLALGVDPRSVAQMSLGYTSCTLGEVRQGGGCPAGINDLDILAGAQNYFNASVLEFDFVPVENSVQFRYIFGSEEYSDDSGFINYQCSTYNDKFGFLISGPGIAGGQGYTNDARNIARLGNGSEVSINSVNNGVVGSSGGAPSAANCTFANGDWIQNTPTPEFLGTIDGTQLNGNTRILTATQSGLIPGQTYHIKLIVTDVNDGAYDSVVYIEAGSFTTEFSCNAGPDQQLCDVNSTTLAASSPATGTWSVISGSGTFVSNTDPNTVVNGLSSGNNVFRWTASDLSCSADVVITLNNSPNAGTNGTLTVCQGTTPTNAELFAALNGTPDAGGSWSNVGLVYTYTVTGVAPCPNATATVTVTEQAPANAGTNGTLTVCQGTTPTNAELFAALNGTPDAGGSWSNVGLVYTYTVTGVAPCPNATATVTVTEQAPANAGTNGTLTVCQGTTPTNAELFAALNGTPDAGGSWSNVGLVYTYTVTGVAPCPNATATVTVTEQAPANAGTNGTLTVCQGTTPTNAELFAALNGTPDAGGSWSNVGLVYTYTVTGVAPCPNATATVTVTEQAPANAGTNGTLTVCQGTTPTNAELFAALNGTPDAGGSWSNVGLVYTYTVTGVAPCPNATATVTVTEQAPANAGTNGTLTVCQGTTPTNAELFAALNGTPDAGGSWSNVGLVYTYTVTGVAPCPNATATVTVTEQAPANAGTNGTLTVCQGTTPTNAELFAALNGTPDAGGSWSNVGLVYTYTVTGVAPCPNATATVTVTEQAPANAGTNGTLTVCQGTTPTNAELFAALNGTPDAGGSWSNVGLVYTYTVTGVAPCPNATATVTVTEQAPANAGTNGTLTVCQGTTPTNAELFAALNGTPDAGGSWSNVGLVYTYTVTGVAPCPNATATVTVTEQAPANAGTNGTLTVCQGTTPTNAELFAALNGTPDAGGSWSNVGLVYTYTVTGVAPCPNATATVTVTEQAPANAGTNGTLTVCQGTTPTNAELFAALNGTPDAGGSWSNVGLVYTYTVTGVAPCPNATATVTVTEQAPANAGTNGTLTVCQGTTPTNAELFAALNGTPDAGGSWSNVGLVYTYTVTGVAPCPNTTATVTLVEIQFPNFQIESGCVDLEYTLSVSPYDLNYTYNWFDSNNNLIGNNEFIIINEADTYTLEVVSLNCSISSFITIDNVFCSIPKGLSPNGDGLNDTWDLSNLDVREVKIFNRYGLEVYQQNNYTNQWDGRDMKGNELPTATYYYVITFESGKQKTGWVYLQRVK